MRFRFPILEEGGAGEEGTKKLLKRYKKDTPGEEVNEKVYKQATAQTDPLLKASYDIFHR